MLVSKEDYDNRYICTGSEVIILNAPVVTTALLLEIKKTKRLYIIENKLYESFDKNGVTAFIDAIDSFDFKLFHFFAGTVRISKDF
jgi:hypothetical protein